MAWIGFIVLCFVSRVIHPQCSAFNHSTAQIVDCEICAALVLILEKCEAFGLASLLVAYEIDICWFAELGKYRYYIAFSELKRQSTNVNISCVAIVCMP